jgi:prevent-host-death family protein
MLHVGIRELRQNPHGAIAAARRGEIVMITEHGTEVAQLSPAPARLVDRLVLAGRLIPAHAPEAPLTGPTPPSPGEPTASEALAQMRAAERY